MSYRFDLPADVENQIYDCAVYIARDNPGRAVTWVDDVLAEMRRCCESPLAHPIDPRLSSRVGRDIRKRPFGNYLIFYHVDEDRRVVTMHLFRHAAREPG